MIDTIVFAVCVLVGIVVCVYSVQLIFFERTLRGYDNPSTDAPNELDKVNWPEEPYNSMQTVNDVLMQEK